MTLVGVLNGAAPSALEQLAESSTEVSGRVHDAIAAHLLQSGNLPVAEIAVIVASIG